MCSKKYKFRFEHQIHLSPALLWVDRSASLWYKVTYLPSVLNLPTCLCLLVLFVLAFMTVTLRSRQGVGAAKLSRGHSCWHTRHSCWGLSPLTLDSGHTPPPLPFILNENRVLPYLSHVINILYSVSVTWMGWDIAGSSDVIKSIWQGSIRGTHKQENLGFYLTNARPSKLKSNECFFWEF